MKQLKPIDRVDAFGQIHAKPLDNSTALSPVHQGRQEFELYHEGFDRVIGRVEAAPYTGLIDAEMVDLELDEEFQQDDDTEIYLAMEDAEEAIADYYRQRFPGLSDDYFGDLGLVEKADMIRLDRECRSQNPGMYSY